MPAEPTKTSTTPEAVAHKGLYMAFVSINDRELAQYLINNTDWEVPFTLTGGSEPHLRGLAVGSLKPRTTQKIQDLLVKDFEQWGVFTFQALFSRSAFMTQRPPLEKRLRFRTNTFFKSRQKAPVLNKDAHLFQLDAEEIAPQVAEKLVDHRFDGASVAATSPATTVPKPDAVVDLHIEKLTKNVLVMNPTEILELQLKTFETRLENAIAHGMGEITFIHGVGHHTLRNELHKRLGKNAHVRYFEDAQKHKFGFGATKVVLK